MDRHSRAGPPPPSTPTGPSPPRRRRRVATASPAPQRGYYGATTRLLRELLLRGDYKATTRLLAIRLLPGYYQATTRLLPGAARAPLGQAAPQQQPSSSAGSAQPSSSEPAPTIRTPRERSRGGRSPRAEQAGQLRSPRTPHVLEQQGVVGVHPWSSTTPYLEASWLKVPIAIPLATRGLYTLL